MAKTFYQKEIPYKKPSKTILYIHIAVYIIVMAILWYYYHVENVKMHGDAYPWEGWFTGTWFLALVGHFCNTYFDNNENNQDKYYTKYLWEKDH